MKIDYSQADIQACSALRGAHEQILDHIGEAVIVTDLAGRIVYVNAAAGDLYDWPTSEMLGRTAMEVNVPEGSFADAKKVMEMEASVNRGAEMVRQLLFFGRGTDSRRTTVPVPDLLRTVEKVANGTFLKSKFVRTIISQGVRELVRMTLESFGYRVMLAGGGDEALRMFRRHRDEITVVLTDLMMPGMSGGELIEHLRESDPEVRIIASSGVAVDTAPGSPATTRADFFLAKPYSTEAILKAMMNATSKTHASQR